MSPEPTVYLVDDDEALRRSFEWLIGSVDLNVETFASASEFLEAYEPENPGCLVVDVRMPAMSGLELLSRLGLERVTMPTIVITGYGDVPTAVRCMKSGAMDFIEKPFNDQLILDRIQQGIERDARQRQEYAKRKDSVRRLRSLTPREHEVMTLVVAGKSNKEVARDLKISPKTVEVHRANVMFKMHAESFAELVRLVERCPADRGMS